MPNDNCLTKTDRWVAGYDERLKSCWAEGTDLPNALQKTSALCACLAPAYPSDFDATNLANIASALAPAQNYIAQMKTPCITARRSLD
jgi:hypothetical protein